MVWLLSSLEDLAGMLRELTEVDLIVRWSQRKHSVRPSRGGARKKILEQGGAAAVKPVCPTKQAVSSVATAAQVKALELHESSLGRAAAE